MREYGAVDEYLPLSIDVKDKDLKATANTRYPTPRLDVSGLKSLTVYLDITVTGAPTVGVVKVTGTLYAKNGQQLGPEIDMVTGIASSAVVTNKRVVISLPAVTTAKTTEGSLGTNVDAIKGGAFLELAIVVTTASNGTVATGSMAVHAAY